MHAGNAEHGVVDSVAFESAVTEGFPGLHAGDDVLDGGANLFVGAIVFLLPGREFGLAALMAVRHVSRARIAAVGDRERPANGGEAYREDHPPPYDGDR